MILGAVVRTRTIADYEPCVHGCFEGMRYSSLLNLGKLDHTSGPNGEKC